MRKVLFFAYLFLFILIFNIPELRSQSTVIDSLETILKKKNLEDTTRVKVLFELAKKIASDDQLKAVELANTALEISEDNKYDFGIGSSYYILALANYYNGDYYKAIELALISNEYYIKSKNKTLIASSYNILAICYGRLGNYQKKLEYLMECKKNAIDEDNIIVALANLGNTYLSIKEPEKSLEFYFEALELAKKNNNEERIGIITTNLADAYRDIGNYKESLKYAEQSFKIRLTSGEIRSMHYAARSLGTTHKYLENYDEALKYFNIALENAMMLSFEEGIAYSLMDIAQINIINGEFNKALKNIKQSEIAAKKTSDISLKLDINKTYTEIFKILNDYKSAFDFLQTTSSLEDSIFNNEKSKQIAELQTIYKTEKQQQEIEKQQIIITRQRIFRNSLIIFTILTLAFVILLFSRFRLKKKTNKILDQKNEELKDKNEEILSQNEEIKSQKEELEVHRNHLENLVEERTIALKEAKERAEESERLKSSFLANMSHEIRTPMNAIIGFTDLLNDPEIDKNTRQELTRLINSNSENLLNLINDIIDIAKIESDQLLIRKRKCMLSDIYSQLISVFDNKRLVWKKEHIGINFNFTDVDKNIILYTDPFRCKQVLSNLIDNALKFTETGEINIYHIVTDNKITFNVTDTGIGLSEEQNNIIFKRFGKIEEDRKKLYRGAGLGLAICKSLTELLGGEIGVESQKDKGSRFYFTIPMDKLK